MTRRIVLVAWLAVVWMVLWRDPTVANLASGIVVALLVVAVAGLPGPTPLERRLRPMAAARFVATFAWKLVEANLVLAREVVTPRDSTRPGVIAVSVGDASELLVTVVANAVSLTPGTLTLETMPSPRTLYVHVLHLYDPERVRADIAHLERLARRALGEEETGAGAAGGDRS